ncbi:hypothetical protein Acsp02_59760 [Actinoplanes sp. NBRC 103695]|nr:hypothetical protein Acsp02_59760 [Actinoplanes sp. NBRC 103695]
MGSHWRLTAVADRRGTTAIPATVDAWLELAADGEFLASDDVNTMNGRFTPTSAGFDVSDTITTLAGYDGNDPVRSAAITGIGSMTFVPPAPSSSPSEAPPAHVTFLSANREHLVVQAAGVRLTFTRSGPAGRLTADLPPVTGSADVPEQHN